MSRHERPCTCKVVVDVAGSWLVGFVQETHVGIEINLALALYGILDFEMVSLLEQNWRLINKNAIQNRVQSHRVLGYISFDLMC